MGVGRIGKGGKGRPVAGSIPPSGNLLHAADITTLGAFIPPTATLDFANGLTGRYVSGNLRLYSLNATTGDLIEFSVPADGSLVTGGSGYTIATQTNNYGDIFQNELQSRVDNGSGSSPPHIGLAQCGCPGNLYWDPTDSRMYWFYDVSYNNTTTPSDFCLGYSTLNDGAHTGTGVKMFALSAPVSEGGFQNRWINGMIPIPSTWATTYVSGKRLGVGFGGGLSIIGNGPPQLGPTLFAMDPPTGTDHDYINNGPIQRLLAYPADSHRKGRPSGLESWSDFSDSFIGTDGSWNWNDGFNGKVQGLWIQGASKQGVLMFSALSGGRMETTISASPAPAHTVFTVGNAGDTLIGSVIKWDSDITAGFAHYPFSFGTVTGVSGNQITVATPYKINQTTGDTEADTTSTPIVGGRCFGGGFYIGGGQVGSVWRCLLAFYDPADLARSALNQIDPWIPTPYAEATFALAGQPSYPYAGTYPSSVFRPSAPRGAWLDTSVSPYRIYTLHEGCPNNDGHNMLIYVHTVAA